MYQNLRVCNTDLRCNNRLGKCETWNDDTKATPCHRPLAAKFRAATSFATELPIGSSSVDK